MKKLFFALIIMFFATGVFASGHVVTASGINPTCNGSCNGSAVATASGGVGPYGYSWTGPATGTDASISGLCAGTYIVTAIDSSDMSSAVYTLNLSQPSPVYTVISGGDTICQGNTVSLFANTTGGTPGYTFSWSPATGLSSTTIYNPLAAPSMTTTYTITATDANGCTANSSTTITVNPLPVITVNSASVCAGQSAVLTASGATSYSWTGGLSGNPATAFPAATTSYTVTGTMSGCAGTAVATVTVNPSPAVSLSPTSVTCGMCNGSISTSASGAITYNWSGPSGFTSTIMNPTNLCQGTYTLTATSSTGCNTIATTTVGNSVPTATVGSVTPANCGACDGSATIFATGGVSPYTYLWSPTGNTTPTGTGLCAGVYIVTVTDMTGCNVNVNLTITNNSTLTGSVNASSTVCGTCNGSANVTVSGGSGPYIYDWFPGTPAGDGTPVISGLCAGSYTVTVTDTTGCVYSGVATVSNSNPVYVTANTTPATCGVCNGTVTVIQTGGTGPYLYDLNNGSPQQTNGNFSGVCSGIYIATVTDVNGCSGMYTVNVPSSNSSGITVNSVVQNESGYGLGNGSINLTVTGSAPPFTFLWSNSAITEDIYSLSPGNYTVTITDNNGDCAAYTYTISTTPSYGFIAGYAYSDNNLNCVYDAGDSPLAGYAVYASNGSTTYMGYTNSIGYYSIWVPTGSYTINPGTTTNLETACTNIYSVTVGGGTTVTNNNFSYVVPPVYDVCVSTWSTGVVPGFNGYYYTRVQNNGNQSATGVVYIVLPSIVSYVSSSPLAAGVSGDTVFWNYTNIPAYNVQYFYVTFYTPPSAVLGTPVVAYVNATVTNGTDINPACNSYLYTRLITGSFDPNDKTVSPSGEGSSGDIALTEDEFSYLIRFQNTGSGPAVNINVTDTLSSMLDLMSFQMLDASHNYIVEILPGNVIRWKFNNIMLPDSTSDEPGSHGHIQFKINKLNAPLAGEVIENKAYIYFDFNEPVITNTAINTYVVATAIEDQENENSDVIVFPNPFGESATFIIKSDKINETYSFEMTDVLGKKVRSINNISGKQFSVSREGLENGIYIYKIYSSEGVVNIGKIVIK